jgi:ubiquitin-protein ligase
MNHPGAVHPRVLKDYKELTNKEKEGIYVAIQNDNMRHICVMLIGAKKTPYENGVFFFTIDPCEMWDKKDVTLKYPFNPPKVKFFSCYDGYIHENLYSPTQYGAGGKVCLTILGTWPGRPDEQWTSLMTFMMIIQSIFQIMDLETSGSYEGFKTRISHGELTNKIKIGMVKLVEKLKKDECPVIDINKDQFDTSIFKKEILDHYERNKEYFADIVKPVAIKKTKKKIPIEAKN